MNPTLKTVLIALVVVFVYTQFLQEKVQDMFKK
jgi:hypothetical protein